MEVGLLGAGTPLVQAENSRMILSSLRYRHIVARLPPPSPYQRSL